MKKLILTACLLSCLVMVSSAQTRVVFEALTIAGTSVGITSTTYSPSGQPQMNHCIGRLATAQVRYRYDGTAPTASTGTLVEIGDQVVMDAHWKAAAIRFIRTGAPAAC